MKIRFPDYVGIFSENGNIETEFKENMQKNDISVVTLIKNNLLNVELTADNTPVRYIKFRWCFTNSEKRNESVKVYSDAWERGYGDLEWRGIVPDRMMPWVCAVSNGSDKNRDFSERFTECFGVKTQPKAMCMWQYDTSGVVLWLDVRCGGTGVILNKRKLDVCDIVFSEYRNISAFDALKAYYKTLCDAPLKADHKIYGTNNWYYAYGITSHEDVIHDTELLVERCKGLKNLPYMVLDSGWQKNTDDGPWDRFREGKFYDMKKLADEIRDLGARPGIWVRPLIDGKFEVTDEKSDQRCVYNKQYLDASHPGVLEYVDKTIRMICDWGYELIKHDFTTFDLIGAWGFQRPDELAKGGWHFWNKNKTTAEVFIDLYKVIYEASKGKALILGCNVIGHLAAGLVHLNRTGDDTSGKDWERVRKYGVNTLAFRMMHHEAFFGADADCIGIMGLIDWTLNKQWLYAVAHSGTSLFVSPKPGVMSDSEVDELKEAYKVNSVQTDTLVPLDWMENLCPDEWLLNGSPIHFNWYPSKGITSFCP